MRKYVAFALGLVACGGGGGGGGGMSGDAAGSDAGTHHVTDGSSSRDGASARPHEAGTDSGSADSASVHSEAGERSDGGTSHDATAPTDTGNSDGSATHDASSADSGEHDAHHEDVASGHDASSIRDASSTKDASHSVDSGSCGFCTFPPAAVCQNATTLEFYPNAGTCMNGACSYTASFTNCVNGCANGTCKPSGWTAMNSSTTSDLRAMWGSSASDVWAVGYDGVAVHYDGNSWTVESPPGAQYLPVITGTGPNDVYTTDGLTNVWHFDGTGWSTRNTLIPPDAEWLGLYAATPSSVWVAALASNFAGARLYPSDGTTLGTEQATSGVVVSEPGESPINALATLAVSPTDIWVGTAPLTHSNGTALTVAASEVFCVSFWAASPTSIFAGMGQEGSVEIYDGMTWTMSNTGTTGQTGGVWGTATDRVFVATFGSGSGEVRSYNGIGWSNATLPAHTPDLYAVYAAPTGEVFAAGDNGTILLGP